jgi:Tol biopolymer transport system component
VIDTRTRAVRTLVGHTSDTRPRWSPDGRTLAYLRTTAFGKTQLRVRSLGEPGRVLARDVATMYSRETYAWSPDSSAIAFVSKTGELETVSADGTQTTKLASDVRCCPTWSPDGRTLAYMTGAETLAFVGVDGSPSALVPPPGRASAPAWSPDGAALAYIQLDSGITGEVNGVAMLWTFATRVAQTIERTPYTDSAALVTFSPDGTNILGSKYIERHGWVQFILDPVASAQVSNWLVGAGTWSPDGTVVLSSTLEPNLEGTADGQVVSLAFVPALGTDWGDPTVILRGASDPSWQPLPK